MSITLTVERDTAEALETLARRYIEGVAEGMQEGDEAVFEYDPLSRIEDIETEARSGFWPWTQGGFSVCLPAALSHHFGTGCAPGPIQPIIDSGDKFIREEWDSQNPHRTYEMLADAGMDGPDWEEFCEFEQEGWSADEDCYFYKARIMFESAGSINNNTGDDRVYMDAYLNTDLNYGRDNIAWLSCYGSKTDQTTGDFKRTFTIAEFLALGEEGIDKLIAEAVDSVTSL